MKRTWCILGFIFCSCVVYERPRAFYVPPPPPPAPVPPPPDAAPVPEESSVSITPPDSEPPPIEVRWAPPPMRVEPIPVQPYPGAYWVGGYWHWQDGQWLWARGYWSLPPRPDYVWTPPYYENREGLVVYVPGYWRPHTAVFVPPPRNGYIRVVEARRGYVGHAVVGPSGCFVPAPPGSRPGIIVPAPIGTHPVVVVNAPPVVRPGMVIRANEVGGHAPASAPRPVTIYAPRGVTQSGQPIERPVHAPAYAMGREPQPRAFAPAPAAPAAPSRPWGMPSSREPMARQGPNVTSPEPSVHPQGGPPARVAQPSSEHGNAVGRGGVPARGNPANRVSAPPNHGNGHNRDAEHTERK